MAIAPARTFFSRQTDGLHQNSFQSTSLSLTPDDQTLLSGSWDETINRWDLPTQECLQTLRLARPYEGMIITEVMGLTEAEIATLKALGALEVN